jgi:transcription antitermination factor NusG
VLKRKKRGERRWSEMAESLQAKTAGPAASEAEVQRWYACYTRGRHEKIVDRLLGRYGFESYLPLVPRMSQWKDRRKQVEWPLFPSYVFGRFSGAEVHRVLGIPGVATVVRANGRPAPIDDAELENIRTFLRALRGDERAPEPVLRPFLEAGRWVEVVSGPFAGVRGVVVEQRNPRRVLVGIRAVGQGMEVDVDAATLRTIEAP